MRYSSQGAIEAEEEDRVPASKINRLIDKYPIFKETFGTKKEAKEWIMENFYDGERHFTSPYDNKTNFYDVAGAADYLISEDD